MVAEVGTVDRSTAIRTLSGLLDGLASLEDGRTGVARYRFQSLVAAGVREPSLEVGYAWRALAEIDTAEGDLAGAENNLKRAVNLFRELARLQPGARVRAQEAEASCLLLGGELMLRRGQTTAGEALLGRARVLLDRLGDERSGEAWLATARLSRLAHDRAGAESALSTAVERYERAENVIGHAEGLIELAMLRRSSDNTGALRMVDLAASMARDAGRVELLARVLLARGMVLEDQKAASEAYGESLERALQAGTRALAGLALVGLGSTGWDGGERPLLAGAQVLLDVEHYPAFGLALIRIGQHAIRVGDPELALAAAEAAWRVFRAMDPEEGLARVLRIVERAFVQLRMPRAVLAASFARASLIGRKEPSAVATRDFFASRAPPAWVAKLASASRDVQLGEARRALQTAVVPALRRYSLLASSFATAQGALDVIGVLAGVSPRAAARQLAPWTAQPIPQELPDPPVPDALGAQFDVRTRLSLSVPHSALPTSGLGTSPRLRRPVYDPDGRLAQMVSGSLDYVDTDGTRAPAQGGAPVAAGQPAASAADAFVGEEFPPDAAEEWSPSHDDAHRPARAPTGRTEDDERQEVTEETMRPWPKEHRMADVENTLDSTGWNRLLGDGWAHAVAAEEAAAEDAARPGGAGAQDASRPRTSSAEDALRPRQGPRSPGPAGGSPNDGP